MVEDYLELIAEVREEIKKVAWMMGITVEQFLDWLKDDLDEKKFLEKLEELEE